MVPVLVVFQMTKGVFFLGGGGVTIVNQGRVQLHKIQLQLSDYNCNYLASVDYNYFGMASVTISFY